MINFTKKKTGSETIFALDPKCAGCSCSYSDGCDVIPSQMMAGGSTSTAVRDGNVRFNGWVSPKAQ